MKNSLSVPQLGWQQSQMPCTSAEQTVEHPYGTLKGWMGSTHFLTKTLDHMSTEMSLHVLAYNMKRVINLVGTKRLLEVI